MRRGAKVVPWSTMEEAWLVEAAGTMDAGEIARRLKRSRHAVRQKAARLGVSLRWHDPVPAGLEWCDVCGKPRNHTSDGECRVCRARRQLAALMEANAEARAESDAAERAIEREKNRVKQDTARARAKTGTSPRKNRNGTEQ